MSAHCSSNGFYLKFTQPGNPIVVPIREFCSHSVSIQRNNFVLWQFFFCVRIFVCESQIVYIWAHWKFDFHFERWKKLNFYFGSAFASHSKCENKRFTPALISSISLSFFFSFSLRLSTWFVFLLSAAFPFRLAHYHPRLAIVYDIILTKKYCILNWMNETNANLHKKSWFFQIQRQSMKIAQILWYS